MPRNPTDDGLPQNVEVNSEKVIIAEDHDGASTTPDRYTRKSSLLDGDAPGQVFKFEKWGICYGSDDKGHIAALLLSGFLLTIMAFVGIIGVALNSEVLAEIFPYLITAFTFVAGFAIGKGKRGK